MNIKNWTSWIFVLVALVTLAWLAGYVTGSATTLQSTNAVADELALTLPSCDSVSRCGFRMMNAYPAGELFVVEDF